FSELGREIVDEIRVPFRASVVCVRGEALEVLREEATVQVVPGPFANAIDRVDALAAVVTRRAEERAPNLRVPRVPALSERRADRVRALESAEVTAKAVHGVGREAQQALHARDEEAEPRAWIGAVAVACLSAVAALSTERTALAAVRTRAPFHSGAAAARPICRSSAAAFGRPRRTARAGSARVSRAARWRRASAAGRRPPRASGASALVRGGGAGASAARGRAAACASGAARSARSAAARRRLEQRVVYGAAGDEENERALEQRGSETQNPARFGGHGGTHEDSDRDGSARA